MPYDFTASNAASATIQTQVGALQTEIRRIEASELSTATALMTTTLQRNALQTQLNAANASITTLTAARDAALADLALRTAERDQAIVERDQALADLAECETNCPPPEPPSLILGGSNKLGYPDLESRLGMPPGSFTHFIPGARFTTGELDKMAVYVAAGVVPSLSFHVGTEADTDYNIAQLVARGWDGLFGGYSIGNEPTQKSTPMMDWRNANIYASSVLPPSWQLVVGPFQRMDIMADPTDPRFIGNWIGTDYSWIDRLGVNVYDKNHSVGQTFSSLVNAKNNSAWHSVDSYATLIGKKIWVREYGAPEQQSGEWNRPIGWKPEHYQGMYDYVMGKLDLYELVNVFNSDVGGDPPPEGWWAWTSTAAMNKYIALMTASQS